ncbi:MAG: hypothetical protein JNL80_00810 [Phycisphaerae bacterium]|nr:hypothetical protein [Phycisphaerae bacterium]
MHTVSRCVGRGRLMADAVRLNWLAARVEFLASLFAIEVLEFAVLPSHFHLLLRTLPELAWCWTDEEVAQRWLTLRGAGQSGVASPVLECPREEVAEAVLDSALIDEWRRRLADLGWFHKELKEPCARMWNVEDDIPGPFWQGRYSAKVALKDAALVSQAIYVLLNRVRAGLEEEVGEDEFTSIGIRVRRLVREVREGKHADAEEAFERRLVNGSWVPVFPANPGSAATLSDSEFSARVARGRSRQVMRLAAREDAEMLLWQATDATVEELASRGIDSENVGGVVRTVSVPRHRHQRRRSEGRAPVDRESLRQDRIPHLENPFATSRLTEGAVPVLPGMTLSGLIMLADYEGRQRRPDKPREIASEAEPAMARIRRAVVFPSGITSAGHEGRLEADGLASIAIGDLVTALPPLARTVVELALASLRGDREEIGELIGQTGTNELISPAGAVAGGARSHRVRWLGTAFGDTERLRSEASRRGSVRVVGVRPVAR